MKHILTVLFITITSLLYSQDSIYTGEGLVSETVDTLNTLKTNAYVLAVHDGDSYKVRFDNGTIRWIRLFGVDAPEVRSNHITATQAYGPKSALMIRLYIKHNRVLVDSLFTDQFKRIVARVYIEKDSNTIDLTRYILGQGLGWWYQTTKISKDEENLLKELQEDAQLNKRGLWSLKGRKIRPSTFRKYNHQ